MLQTRNKWALELLWLLFSVLIALFVLFPIHRANIQFPWLTFNITYIIGMFLLLKHLFLFRHHPLRDSKLFKVFLIMLAPFCFFPILEGIHSFLEFNDREGLQSIMGHLSVQDQNRLMKYIRVEYLVSAVTCLLGIFALIIKMIRSLWRQYRLTMSN